MKRSQPTWNDKLQRPRQPVVKRLEKAFADMPAGTRMLIASPALIDAYAHLIPPGRFITIQTLRQELAGQHRADHTCPTTTGLFLRIVAEAAWERHLAGEPLASLPPFWRIIAPDSPLAAKLACGAEFIRQQRQTEATSIPR